MTKTLPVFVPCRNEEKHLPKTISAIKSSIKFAGYEPKIVVVNDGSKDDTSRVAIDLGCELIELKDRGYSALGKPELAETHNAGYRYIVKNFQTADYLMVIGGDTVISEDYVKILINELDNDHEIVITAGILKGRENVAPNAVTGSGRIIRMSFWKDFGGELPVIHHAWESYPIFYANSIGKTTKTFKSAVFLTQRPPLSIVDWYHYGLAMKETGALFSYCLLRALRLTSKGLFKNAFRLIKGYLYGDAVMYPKEIQDYVKKYQKDRMLRFFRLKSTPFTK